VCSASFGDELAKCRPSLISDCSRVRPRLGAPFACPHARLGKLRRFVRDDVNRYHHHCSVPSSQSAAITIGLIPMRSRHNFLQSFPRKYRGISYDIFESVDVHPCWRWIFVVNERRRSGQTKISRRAAEIQAQLTIDKALGHPARTPSRLITAARMAPEPLFGNGRENTLIMRP
jgi:hypothetical protein